MCNAPAPPPHMAIMLAHGAERFEFMPAPNDKRLVFTEALRAKLSAAGVIEAGQAWLDNCNNVLHGPAK